MSPTISVTPTDRTPPNAVNVFTSTDDTKKINTSLRLKEKYICLRKQHLQKPHKQYLNTNSFTGLTQIKMGFICPYETNPTGQSCCYFTCVLINICNSSFFLFVNGFFLLNGGWTKCWLRLHCCLNCWLIQYTCIYIRCSFNHHFAAKITV